MSLQKSLFFVVLFIIPLTGCHKMYLHNESSKEMGIPIGKRSMSEQKWHHELAFELVELSEPVVMSRECEGRDWRTAKVEKSAVNSILSALSFGVYGQWSVQQECG